MGDPGCETHPAVGKSLGFNSGCCSPQAFNEDISQARAAEISVFIYLLCLFSPENTSKLLKLKVLFCSDL